MLWSIAAGPLVNVALIPILQVLVWLVPREISPYQVSDAYRLVTEIRYINYGLLIFNLLPIYPLDGGQIFRALLWFPFGRIRSLQVASVVGLIGGALLALLALWWQSIWMAVLAFFLLSRAGSGWQHARALVRQAEAAPIASELVPPR
jgi:Zn-dependent protease